METCNHLKSRRGFLKASIASALLLKASRAEPAMQPDTVVIGAGAAGLAAARTLQEGGSDVLLLEGSNRIGGRAITDTTIFGIPYDLGASWLHSAHLNPFVSYGQQNGFDVYPEPGDNTYFIGNRKAKDDEAALAERLYRSAYQAIAAAGRRRQDISALEAIGSERLDTSWGPTVAAEIGAWEMGADLDQFSSLDWWHMEDGRNYFCREGFGALVAYYGRNVPVSLNTTVTGINWSGTGVTVQTQNGDIRAERVIVTVSTGVLASGAIHFSPALPATKEESFNAIRMGTYNHIALQFRRNVFDLKSDHYIARRVNSNEAIGWIMNLRDTSLCFGYTGGRYGKDLEHAGPSAAVDIGLSDLAKIFGNGIRKDFIKGFFTTWGQNPYTNGSYAAALPGKYEYRQILREPVAERIYFAGEACHPSLAATVAGAFLSGRNTALQML